MTWKLPESEAKWEEVLSAYADGELDADAAAALEAHLQHDDERARQLASIRETSALLQSWEVDAPSMDHALRAAIEDRKAPTGRPSAWRGLWQMAAVFAVGVLTGILMMNARPAARTEPAVRVAAAPERTDDPVLTPTAADSVFRELEAAELARRIERDAAESRWKAARSGMEQMRSHYADTNAANKFADHAMGRHLLRRMLGRSN